MYFESGQVYHVYNRGNHSQSVFFNRENYIYFLSKVRREWLQYCDILCYCLMPTHFHFMLVPFQDACEYTFAGGIETQIQKLSKVIGKTLSSYVRALQNHRKFSGNLFQKKTKAKCLTDHVLKLSNGFVANDYLINCLHYIHLNPEIAKLVLRSYDWEFSSLLELAGLKSDILCNRRLLFNLTGLCEQDLRQYHNIQLNQDVIDLIW
jgi:putative transposase